MNPDVAKFFDGENVMVVGGAGFVGSQLTRLLIDVGAHVTVIDNFSRGKTMVDDALYLELDASRSLATLARVMRETDRVFNLAASVAGVLYNMDHQLDMYASNIRLLINPVIAAKQAGVTHFVQVSSVCIYAPEHNSPSREDRGFSGTPHPANAGYAEAKRDGERVAYWSGIPHVTVVRPSNIVGPGDYYDEKAHVVPAFIKRAHDIEDGGEFILYGSPSITREFIHCKDVATGMMFAMALGKSLEVYNLGCNGHNTISMSGLAINILKRVGKKAVIVSDASLGGGDSNRWSDSSKIENATGWRFMTPLTTALDESIADYRERFLNDGNA